MIAEPSTASNVQQAVPFLWVYDMERCIRYYVDGLGFTMTKQWVDEGRVRRCRLELGTAALMLQEFWSEGHDRNLPDGKVGVGVSICFICKDAVALWHDFEARGLAPKRPSVGNGMWVTELSDPNGYHLFFESPTDEPEETVLQP